MKPESACVSLPRRHWLFPLVALAALALSARPAAADLIVSLQTVTDGAGTMNDLMEATLANTGPSPVNIGAFNFGFSVSNTHITFTQVDIFTTPSAYIFAGHSFLGPIISFNGTGQSMEAGDVYDVPNSGITLAAGNTVGLGRIFFNIDATAPSSVNPVVLNSSQTNLSDSAGGNVPVTTLNNGSITIIGAASPVPEPATVLLAGISLGTSLLTYVCRRRRCAA
jgi:hypothetical protein